MVSSIALSSVIGLFFYISVEKSPERFILDPRDCIGSNIKIMYSIDNWFELFDYVI